MQHRIVKGWFSLRLMLPACLLLSLPVPAAIAQGTVTGSGATQVTIPEDKPQLLLVLRREPKASAHDEALRFALQDAIVGLMRNAGHYQVTSYSPSAPLIAHALLIHSVSSIDLSEPLQPEGMQHLAVALGIRTVLFLTPTFDKTELKMESNLYQNAGQDAWQIGVTGEETTPYQYGKNHLNTKQIVAVTVDALATRLSLPSHLAADLNLKTMEAAQTKQLATQKPIKPTKPAKGDQARNDTTTKAVQSAPPDTQTVPDTPQTATTQASTTTTDTSPPTPVVVQPIVPTAPTVTPSKTRVAKADKTTKNAAKTNEDPATAVTAPVTPNSVSIPEGGPGRADLPPLQTISHPNYETLADHYHDNHDLANTISLLRSAVNERPRDIPLRQKLIQAYQERKMPEAALAEIARALQLAPDNGGLYRLYGDTLLNKGDVPDAEKAFRDAVRLNANDISARIALGDSLMLDNQYADALDAYTTAQKTDPHSPLPHRRLARVFLLRSSSDPTQYAASLEETAKARELTSATDKISYQEDYSTLMQITEGRLRELLEEISGNFIAMTKGKQSGDDTLRTLSDIKVRVDAISNYLDKVPSAVGQEATQIHYSQAATLVVQCVILFRSYVNKNDPSVNQQRQGASAEAYQELDTAHKRLTEIRAAILPQTPIKN